MKGSLTATTLTAPCSTLSIDYWLELCDQLEREKAWWGGYIRIAEDNAANAAETVNADKCFRHYCA